MALLDTPTERSIVLHNILEQLASAAPTERGQPATSVSLTDLEEKNRAYVQGIVDMLRLLGAIDLLADDETVIVPSVQAGYLMLMVLSLLDGGLPLVDDWQREGLTKDAGHPFGSAVDLLGALELRRRELQPNASVLRQIDASVGVIVQQSVQEPAYLVVWDGAANAWQLVGGRCELRDGSPRATLLRELSEELECPPLCEGEDVSIEELGTIAGRERLSPTYGLLTSTTFHLYFVQFLNGLPPMHAGVRWVSERELLARTTSDNQAIAADPLLYLRGQVGPDLFASMVNHS